MATQNDVDDEGSERQFEVSHQFTDFQGIPTATESVIVPAMDEEQAIDRAKQQFENEVEDENSIEVSEY